MVSRLHGLISISHPVSQPITLVAFAELLRPTHLKLNEFLGIDLDSPKLTSHAGKAEVVTTVIKCGHLFISSLNAKKWDRKNPSILAI